MTETLHYGQTRRARLRASGRNGLDAVEVDETGLVLTVLLYGKAPEDLGPEHFRITGGRRITGIRVRTAELLSPEDPDLEDRVRLNLDRVGDFATYTLHAVTAGPDGVPTGQPHPAFDPRYASLDFSFKQHCPTDADCKPGESSQGTDLPPAIDYLAKDYSGFRQLLLDRLSLTVPDWRERRVPDLGIALAELLAYTGDRLSYKQDAVAGEAYLDTARERISVRRHVRLVDYPMHDGCAARTAVHLQVDRPIQLNPGEFRFITLKPGILPGQAAVTEAQLRAAHVPDGSYEIFEPLTPDGLCLHEAHNRISLWTWGGEQTLLPPGTTSATLWDCDLQLAPGDLLLFEEITGPATGRPADADPAHRQVVRLTGVTPAVDPLYDNEPLLEVSWDRADALTFPLLIATDREPGCPPLEVSVARGNLVLVEHGRLLPREPITVPAPVLKRGPVTQHAAFGAPEIVAEQQARLVARIPARARGFVRELWAKVRDGGTLTEPETTRLTVLFGRKPLARLGRDPLGTLVRLLSDFDEFLAAKLRRINVLTRRARRGVVLDEGIAWELEQSWGEGCELDPRRPEFLGPLARNLPTDPRTALPAVLLRDEDGNTWTPRRDLLDSGPADRHFVGELDDEGRLHLRFGDNRHGRTPRTEDNLTAEYRIGKPTAGNVGRDTITRLLTRQRTIAGINRVRNPLPGKGGTNPEPVSQVRDRAPVEPTTRLLRAVTAEDYATLAGQVRGVQRAAAALRWNGSWYEAQVAVDPLGQSEPPPELLDTVRDTLRHYRKIGHDLQVGAAQLVPVDVALEVCAEANHVNAHVRAALLKALGGNGLFHPDNQTFGEPVRAGRIIATAAALPGVRGVRLTRLQRLFAPPAGELDRGLLPLAALEVAQLDNDPARPENGRLTVTVRGGR
ncbi:putative baseplate assembly protein [Crossiella cryophila]|uniref:Putative phage baseplate assembly protein n=1 Tax=Crossiella cryophila TaxID=43355 RepID=A0A7W7FUB7_9PSEU|nr:putative baseplate assembly protein [Crossiella cryophila]MBB4677915.1 putative phage baseplate assembly protein [Crossiella cryophila]